jgi:rubredoxin
MFFKELAFIKSTSQIFSEYLGNFHCPKCGAYKKDGIFKEKYV